MKLLTLVLAFLTMTACHTSKKNLGSPRNPGATTQETWKEIVVTQPETYLDTRRTEQQIETRRFKDFILKACGVKFTSNPYSEADLLFIRLNNWPEKRLSEEYQSQFSETELKCLIRKVSSAGV